MSNPHLKLKWPLAGWLLGPLLVLSAACAGDGPALEGALPPAPTAMPTAGNGANSAATAQPTAAVAPDSCETSRYIPPRRLTRVSTEQYLGIVARLLGADAVEPSASTDPRLRDFAPVPETHITTGELTRIHQIARYAVSTLSGEKLTELLACEVGQTEEACIHAFLQGLATRAFGRVPSAEELSALSAVYEQGKARSVEAGVQLAVQAILQAPSTLLRSELGDVTQPTSAGQPVPLTSYEIATQLAAFLLDSVPDQPLLAAAAEGRLATPTGIEEQVDRLLALPRVQQNLTRLLVAAYGANRVFTAAKDPSLFPEYDGALAELMYEETRRFVQAIAWDPTLSLNELLTSKSSFVTESLAELYGVPYPGASGAEFLPVRLPGDQRAGILTQASVLTTRSRSDTTSVVSRGLFVRGELLCLPKVPAPATALLEEVERQVESGLSEAELAAERAASPVCGGCHQQFDAFGLLLERYDPIGRYRTEEAGNVIQAGASLDGLAGFEGQVENVVAFADQVAQSGQFQACLSENMLAYSLQEPRDNAVGNDCNLQQVRERLNASGFSIGELVKAVVTTDAFRFRQP